MTEEKSLKHDLFPLWFLKSKVKPARQRTAILKRPKIITALNKSLSGIVSLIHAPAGYGKSTALLSWTNDLLNQKINVAWVSIDQEDNDPIQLIHYITFALFTAGIDITNSGINAETYKRNNNLKNLISILVRVIEDHEQDVVLILDDFENLQEPTIEQVILPLIDYAPENFHLAIATRNDNNLKIANLELKGLVNRISTQNLKFTLFELENFLSDFVNNSIIKKIYTLTEGWPVAVQLIRSAVNQQTGIEKILSNISKSDSTIEAYLSQQIFENLPNHSQLFLLDISLVNRISCKFANYLRESTDSNKQFSQLKSINALVLPVDDVEQTYKLHPLFRDFLIKKLTYDFPSRKIMLCLRAAYWYANNNDIVQATRFYLNAEKPELAAEFIGSIGSMIWLKEGLARLRIITNLLDKQVNSPAISVIKCIIYIKDGDVYLARDMFTQVVANLKINNDKNIKNNEQLLFDLSVIETLLTVYEGSQFNDEFINDLKQSLAKIPTDQHYKRGHFFTCLCGLHVNTGAFDLAKKYAYQAIDEFDKDKAFYGKSYLYFHMGELLFSQGKTIAAKKEYKEGSSLVKRYCNDDKAIKFVANVLQLELNYELNNIVNLPKTAETLYKELEENEAWFNIYVAGYCTSINTILLQQSKEQALGAIQEAFNYVEKQKLERVKIILTCLKVNVLLSSNDINSAKLIFNQSSICLDDYRYEENKHIAWREREMVVQTHTRLLILDNKFDDALDHLNYFLANALKSGHIRSSFKYLILLAITYHKKSDQQNMLKSLDKALLYSLGSGFIRSFLDEGIVVKELLSIYIKAELKSDDKIILFEESNLYYAETIIKHFENVSISKQPIIEFSEQEIKILKCLEQGQANKVIARQIGISHNTVSYHLKKMFTKLNACNRSQAVAIAREKSLI